MMIDLEQRIPIMGTRFLNIINEMFKELSKLAPLADWSNNGKTVSVNFSTSDGYILVYITYETDKIKVSYSDDEPSFIVAQWIADQLAKAVSRNYVDVNKFRLDSSDTTDAQFITDWPSKME